MEEPKELILTVGLPYSGKSTWARTHGGPIVSPDAIRLALHGQRYAQEAEDMVWTIAKVMARALFGAGHTHVIVDACNVTANRRDFWKSKDWIRRYVVTDIHQKVCRERAALRGDFDIIPIIERMAGNFELDGVYYGTSVEPMEKHIERPGQHDLTFENVYQIYHEGTANDPWPS